MEWVVGTEHGGGAAGRRGARITGGVALLLLVGACSTSTGPGACAQGSIDLSQQVCLDLSAAGDLRGHRGLIEDEIGGTLQAVRELVPVTRLRISVEADPSRIIPEVGMGGFNPGPHQVRLFADPDHPELASVLRTWLRPTLAHEIHHALRRRAVGYGSTLLEAAVTEGLADHFAMEVAPGDPPPWAVALADTALATWIPEVTRRATGSYDHPAWFFGTTSSIPRWTGYAVGFELVRRTLERRPGDRASSLVGAPAAWFIPPPALP